MASAVLDGGDTEFARAEEKICHLEAQLVFVNEATVTRYLKTSGNNSEWLKDPKVLPLLSVKDNHIHVFPQRSLRDGP